MELVKKKLKKGRAFIVVAIFIIGILIVFTLSDFSTKYLTKQENELLLRIDHTKDILNRQIEDYPTEVNYLVKLYGKEQYLRVGNCNCVIRYENEQFNIGYMVDIPIGEHYLFYPELQFNEFYDKFIIGHEMLSSDEIEHYVGFLESRKMTEEGAKETRSFKLWLLKKIAGWFD